MLKQIRKVVSIAILVAFISTSVKPMAFAQVGQDPMPSLPALGSMVHLSQHMAPLSLVGLKINPKEPFRFQFIVSTGDRKIYDSNEVDQLVRYFFTGVTTPDKQLWVNLSPVERGRVINPYFGHTQMGRELLELDYILKQLTSSLMYPESTVGKAYWSEVYKEAYKKLGSTKIPVNVFNKVWIVSKNAQIFEHNDTVFITNDSLDVMLDCDHQLTESSKQTGNQSSQEITQKAIRDVILPIIRKEVNEGERFASLRQIHRALILATWYKMRLKEALLVRAYANQNKIKGMTHNDPQAVENIFNQYVKAFKRGVYNYIREEKDSYTGEIIPRKYFAGGFDLKIQLTPGVMDPGMLTKSDLYVSTYDATPIGPGLSSLSGSKVLGSRVLTSLVQNFKRTFLLPLAAAAFLNSGTHLIAQDAHALNFGRKAKATMDAYGNSDTHLVPSHIGMQGLPDIAFTYDLSAEAIAFHSVRQDAYARTIMDYFQDGVQNGSLTRSINGKRAVVNAVSVESGAPKLEFTITPGPNAWIGLAALTVDSTRYLSLAQTMGDAIIAMQNEEGGITDGDRNPNAVNTEPHMDGVDLLYRLYDVTKDTKWKKAADKGKAYFYTYLYDPSDAAIRQGKGIPKGNGATDVYTWTLSGPVAQELPLSELKRLNETMLKRFLVRVTAPVPGGEIRTLTLTDYTDPRSAFASSQRHGVHPLGSPEWTGGMAMAVQTAAVRLAAEGDLDSAKVYKAMAEILISNVENSFGTLADGNISAFYATEKGIAVGHGWQSPWGQEYKGSPIGLWFLMTEGRVNPFTGKNYSAAYQAIDATGPETVQRANDFINAAVLGKEYSVVDAKNAQDSGANQPSSGQGIDLLGKNASGVAQGPDWKSTYVNVDIQGPIHAKAGQIIRISFKATGTKKVFIGVLTDDESPGTQPQIKQVIGLDNAGHGVFEFTLKQDMDIHQFFAGHGDLVWGKQIGSQDSTVTFFEATISSQGIAVPKRTNNTSQPAPKPQTVNGDNVKDLLTGKSVSHISGSNWKSTYVDFGKVPVVPGEKIRASLEVKGADRVEVAVYFNGESYDNEPTSHQTVDVKNGKVDVELVVPDGFSYLTQLSVAHGNEAWQKPMGDQKSTVRINSIEQIKGDKAQLGGIDLTRISLRLDKSNGAVSFDINDSFVNEFKERLFGILPIAVSKSMLTNLNAFLTEK